MRLNFLICGLSVWKARITGSDPVGNSSRSERTRAIEAPCAYLLFFHTAGEDDGTGSTTRRYVLCPSANVLNRCRFPYCALRAAERCDVHEEHGGFSLRRGPDLPVCNRGDSAADHAGLAAPEWHRAAATPGSSRGNSRRSVRLPMECHARHRSNGACCPV